MAVYTDRRDDFVTIIDEKTGKEVYDPEDDPGIWFQAMKASINNAYREVARALLMPDTRREFYIGDDMELDLTCMQPDLLQLIAVYNADESAAIPFDFVTKNRIRLRSGKAGDKVLIHYHFVPEPLAAFDDEPIFPEGLVDPMIYVCRAAADLWMLERKAQPAQMWETRYFSLLGSVRRDMKSASMRRIKKSRFR